MTSSSEFPSLPKLTEQRDRLVRVYLPEWQSVAHVECQNAAQILTSIIDALSAEGGVEELFVLFDGPPSHESGRFVEVENSAGQSRNTDVDGSGWQEKDRLWYLGPFVPASVARGLTLRLAAAEAKSDAEMERVKACEHIAEGEEGWEILRDLCPSTSAVAQLRGWVTDLQSGMYINCVYCGHRYGPKENTPPSMAEILKEHAESCPQHPMSGLKKRAEAAESRAEQAERQRDNLLARIFRDGGQRQDQFASRDEACAEADIRAAEFIAAANELPSVQSAWMTEKERAEQATALLGAVTDGCSHTRIFLTTREKMHPTGVQLWDKAHEAARAFLAKPGEAG